MTDWNNLKPPVAPVDGSALEIKLKQEEALASLGWGVAPVKPQYVEGPDSWPVNPEDAGVEEEQVDPYGEDDIPGSEDAGWLEHEAQLTEAIWTATALDSAQTKASVVNSLAGTKDAFNVDKDGELTRMKEIATGEQPLGYYIAYSDGKWLHAILSGPYNNEFALDAWGDAAYDLMANDAAFKLAFKNTFDRSGIYLAQIPLSAKRHGAYGVLS